jgi:hypothetical protein
VLRYRDDRGSDWADIIDMLTMHPEARRKLIRLLSELEAQGPERDPNSSRPPVVRTLFG